MIAVSSFKPVDKDFEYATHQFEAFRSWKSMVDGIVYLNDFDPAFSSSVTRWVPCKGFPRIKDMVAVAAKQVSRYVALINSDIYLHERFRKAQESIEKNQVIAAVSKRFGYTHPDFNSAKIMDHGLDIFITTPRVWKKVHQAIPDDLWIGHYLWDTWMSGFLNNMLKNKMVNFTDYRCVFHPIHEKSAVPHDSEIKMNSRYLRAAGLPAHKLK